jgi:hypothetical protein
MTAYYVQPHVSQFDGSAYAGSNCTPTSLANGIAAVTRGVSKPTGSRVRAVLARSEETNPATPGWSIPDADKAAARLGVAFDDLSGTGWQRLRTAHETGHYLIVQGDSDKFSNATCSGAFDGDHCIGIHPATLGSRWWIDDPICRDGRWEEQAVLMRYAQDLSPMIRFGQLGKVPNVAESGYRYNIKAYSTIRSYAMSVPPTSVSKGRITGWVDQTWGPRASSAPCGPVRQAVYKGTTVNVARVSAGVFAGQWCRVGVTYGTTVTDT